jgi:hypothetical protein
MATVAAFVIVVAGLVSAQAAADPHKALEGKWQVDEKARLEASPLYKLSTPAKRKELEAQTSKMPATQFVFTADSYAIADAPDTRATYTVAKRTGNSLVLATVGKDFDGKEVKDELTAEYLDDSTFRLTWKSTGIPLRVTRQK